MKVKLLSETKPLILHTDEGFLIKLNTLGIGQVINAEIDPTVPTWLKTLHEDDLFILNCGTSTLNI